MPVAALAVVLARLPFVAGWLGHDESGYLAVGQQWHSGGTSLYGGYWVDRPPLLITVFRLAAVLGGAVPLRLLGIVAAVVSVLAVGWTARRLAGPRAATWAAVVAAAFLVSPLAGATEVDGELLAAPFVAVGIAGAVGALSASSRRRLVAAGACAGAAGVAAVLVKQNMLDVFVFAGVAGLLAARYVGPAHLARVAAGVVGGGALAAGVSAVWTVAHGTSLGGVWFAMYPFRVAANRVMAAHPSSRAAGRAHLLLLDAALSGMVLVAALLVTGLVRARRDHPSSSRASSLARAVPVALAATVAYDAVSIHLGEGFWSHYLVELAVPLALAAGLAAERRPRSARGSPGVSSSPPPPPRSWWPARTRSRSAGTPWAPPSGRSPRRTTPSSRSGATRTSPTRAGCAPRTRTSGTCPHGPWTRTSGCSPRPSPAGPRRRGSSTGPGPGCTARTPPG